MRWVSSKESVAKGEVSVLAIVETLCAIALVFYLSAHFNTLRWLAIAMCVSPLLLLRTEESTRLGIKWFDHAWAAFSSLHAKADDGLAEKWRNSSRKYSIVWIARIGVAVLVQMILETLFIVVPPVLRVTATLISTLKQPFAALSEFTKNWTRVTVALDSRFAPELMPEHPLVTFGYTLRTASREQRGYFLSFSSLPFLFLPALFYRWSLKATSIIYAPLVFVARSTFSEGNDLRTKLELIKRGDLSRIRVLYGIAAIAAFLVKLVLMAKWSGFAAWWNGNPITEFLALYVAPSEIPKWQLAERANSVLAIGSMFFARHALLRSDLGHPFPETPVKRILGFVSGLRWVLALYAIVCTGYITMRAARDWNLPALGQKWWPW